MKELVHFGQEEICSVTAKLQIGIAKKRRISMTRIQWNNLFLIPFSMVVFPPFLPVAEALVAKTSISYANILKKMNCKIFLGEFLQKLFYFK